MNRRSFLLGLAATTALTVPAVALIAEGVPGTGKFKPRNWDYDDAPVFLVTDEGIFPRAEQFRPPRFEVQELFTVTRNSKAA